jgi:hypothetical protein
MSSLHVNHLKTKIEKFFKSKIDLSDLEGRPQEEINKAFYSRGLAAYTLHTIGSADLDLAVKSVVDGFGDNGVDAIYFDRVQKVLWLVQSKWIESGSGEPDSGQVLKFIQGIKDLIDFKLERFNKKTKELEKVLAEALGDATVRIKVTIAYTGQNF